MKEMRFPWLLRSLFHLPFSLPCLAAFIDDMGIGGQAKQLLNQGYEKTNQHQYPQHHFNTNGR
jgi:hypothetical protein